MITEDLDGFLADFGVDATLGSVSAKVIFDMPDALLLNDAVMSTSYMITYRSDAFTGMVYGAAITVDGQAYTVNRDPMKIDDGAFSRAELSKT